MSLYCVGAVHRLRASTQPALTGGFAIYGINLKTVSKWKRWATTAGAPTVPKAPSSKAPSSTVITRKEEAVTVAFRKHMLLPLMIAFTRVAYFQNRTGRRWGGQMGPASSSWRLARTQGAKHYGSLAVVT